jgi:flagellar biosynthesis anti-sigma factor FlgM
MILIDEKQEKLTGGLTRMIENNSISSLSTNPADQLQPAEKKVHSVEQPIFGREQDKVEVSANAKLLSKATTILSDSQQVQNDKVAQITQQVQDGMYQIPINKLAGILVDHLFTKE